MKLRKTLTVGGNECHIVAEDITLSLYSPGRAVFTVKAEAALSGIVQFSLGYSNQSKNQLFFTGYVEESQTVDKAQQKLFCRELTGVLYAPLPCSLRHSTLREILALYTEKTGLQFLVPAQPYADKRTAFFHTLGNGFHGLETLGSIFGIGGYIWQQQGDGAVFVGSWEDSRWASRPVQIGEEWFMDIRTDGSKELGAIPALRPGVKLNGQYISTLRLYGHTMVVKCANRLKR